MAALDWSQCPAVESIPGKVGGAWVFKGTRLPVATVIENLEDLSIDETAQAKGWDTLSNGELLKAAEGAGVDVRLTTDRRIRYQQNLAARRIAVVALTGSTKWSRVRRHVDIATAVAAATTGSYSEVEIPFD